MPSYTRLKRQFYRFKAELLDTDMELYSAMTARPVKKAQYWRLYHLIPLGDIEGAVSTYAMTTFESI